MIRNAEANFLKSRVSDASTPAKGKFDEGSFCSSTNRREVNSDSDDDTDTDDDGGTPPPPPPPLSLFTCAGSDPGEDDEGKAAFPKLSETLLGSSPRSAEWAIIAKKSRMMNRERAEGRGEKTDAQANPNPNPNPNPNQRETLV